MSFMIARHGVNDFDAWKSVYDAIEPQRKESGCTGGWVYRDADDPQTVTVIHEWPTLQEAQAFVNSDVLRSAMERAGVSSAPEIHFVEAAGQSPN